MSTECSNPDGEALGAWLDAATPRLRAAIPVGDLAKYPIGLKLQYGETVWRVIEHRMVGRTAETRHLTRNFVVLEEVRSGDRK